MDGVKDFVGGFRYISFRGIEVTVIVKRDPIIICAIDLLTWL